MRQADFTLLIVSRLQESQGQVPDCEGHNRDLFMKGLEGSQTHYHRPSPQLQKPPMCVRYAAQCKCVTSQGHTHAELTRGGLPAACPLKWVGSPSPAPCRLGKCKSLQLSVPDSLPIKVRSTDYLGAQPCYVCSVLHH